MRERGVGEEGSEVIERGREGGWRWRERQMKENGDRRYMLVCEREQTETVWVCACEKNTKHNPPWKVTLTSK